MTADTIEPSGDRTADRLAITHRINLFCRGSDRRHEESIVAAFHPDAELDLGAFKGTPREFVAWHRANHDHVPVSFHHVGNILIEFSGPNDAFAETYVIVLQSHGGTAPGDAPGTRVAAVRYIDHFQRRGDEWRIRQRETLADMMFPLPASMASLALPAGWAVPSRNERDPSWVMRARCRL